MRSLFAICYHVINRFLLIPNEFFFASIFCFLLHFNFQQLDTQNIRLKCQVDELQKIATNTQKQFADVNNAVNRTNDETKNHVKQLEEQIDNLQLELSKLIGDKLEFEEIRQNYIDELDCLKVNCVAAEELAKQSKAESLELKAENLTLKQELEKLKKSMEEQGHELSLAKAQVRKWLINFPNRIFHKFSFQNFHRLMYTK